MTKIRTALRYSKALFELDKSQSTLDRRLGYFKFLSDIIEQNPELMQFLQAPHIDVKEKKSILESILIKNNDSVFIQFIIYLAHARRISYLKSIGEEFHRMADEFLNYREVKIITAVPLDADSENLLKQVLENGHRKKVTITNQVDPGIIGGAILIVNNEMLDNSVAGKLRKIKEDLLKTTV